MLAEVLDERGMAAQRGNLTITHFANRVVPLVRYSTGDAGRIDKGPCDCGRPYARIRDIDGRISLMVKMADGTEMTSILIPHVLKDYPWAQEFQAEQAPAAGKLIVRIRRDEKAFNEESFARLRRAMEGLLKGGAEVQWRFGERFLPVPTGKHVSFVSTIPRGRRPDARADDP